MSFVLMLVGIGATAVGAILIGLGIPINEFSLGNTLILAGTVSAVGGLIILAMSRAVGQLARIADSLAKRPLATSLQDGSEAYQPEPARTPPQRSAAPPRTRTDAPLPRGPEPRMQSEAFDSTSETDSGRAPPVIAPGGRSAGLEEPDASASPRAPGTGGWRPPPRPSAEPRPRKPSPPEPRRSVMSDNPFDAALERRPSAPTRREPALDPRSEPAGTDAAKPEAVTVLKSGVVDGMAYTLYTDGSIEAELAQGVVRFGSIEELRNHLEKSA